MLCSCGWRWMMSPHCIWFVGVFSYFSIYKSNLMFRETFHKSWITPTFHLANEVRVYLLWYVCSRGPLPPFLPSTPYSSIFPSAAYRHRAVPASPWLARLAATRTADAAAVKDAGGGAQCFVDTGHIGYDRSISPLPTHLSLTHRPLWMYPLDPLRLLLGKVAGWRMSC